LPPSFVRLTATFGTYTTSASFGSTVMCSKYHPRPLSAGSDDIFVHVAPPSSERKNADCTGAAAAPPRPPPPAAGAAGADVSGSRQSTTAYTRRGFPADTAMPHLPIPDFGSPAVSCFHVLPPSVDLKIPPPSPLDGRYVYHGGRRVFHSPA